MQRRNIIAGVTDTPLFPVEDAADEVADAPADVNAVEEESRAPEQRQVLYRKWRPQAFAEVAGQDAVTRTLRNSIASGNLAHAYLFCGPRGTGKTTLGRLLAKAANCDAPVDGEPCNKCESCRAFIDGRAMDFVELDAASNNSVDHIRQLRENVVLTPMAGRRKVYLLDEVHMLSNAAENALLKTLEEPPPHIVFVLATTEAHKVAGTIISRCQRFDLKRIPLRAVVDRMTVICEAEGYKIDGASLEEIARASTGSLRDGINALEQVTTYYGSAPTSEQVKEALGIGIDARSGQFVREALAGDLGAGLATIASVRDDGVDVKEFAKQVVQYLRGLLLAQAGVSASLNLPSDIIEEVKSEAKAVSRESVLRTLRSFGSIEWNRDRDVAAESLPLELALIEVCGDSAPLVGEKPARPEPVREEEQVSVPTAAGAVEVGVPPAAPQSAAPKTPDEVRSEPVAEASTIDTGEDLLEQVRATLRKSDKSLAALINGSCDVKSIEDGRVTLGFYHTFHLERAETGGTRKSLEEAFSAVLGTKTSVALEHTPRGPEAEKPPQAGGHLVQAAREKYGARAVPQDD